MDLSKKIKTLLFRTIISEKDFWGIMDDDLGWMPFLSQIWNLRELPSQDSRFTNAYDDVFQHTIRNDDWELEYLFLERFKIIEDNVAFIKFIEAVVSSETITDRDETLKWVLLINPFLEREGLSLLISGFDENESPIYRIIEVDSSTPPEGVAQNQIPFYVIKDHLGRSDRYPSAAMNKSGFYLIFDMGWNDYGSQTKFFLSYSSPEDSITHIGSVKIGCDEEKDTSEHILDEFYSLESRFYSLGQDLQYYARLKKLFDNSFESVLFALKDVAFFPDIQEKVETKHWFINSLIRYDEPERVLREAKFTILGYDSSQLYKFTYLFTPPYSESSIDFSIEFGLRNEYYNRVVAIIGKNGTGKTKLATSLPIDLSKRNNEVLIPKAPIFSKVIAVSYSVFDRFTVPKKSTAFNYVYCGLRDEKGELRSRQSLIIRFHNAWKEIQRYGRIDKWRKILLTFLEEEIVDSFLIPLISNERNQKGNSFSFHLKGFKETRAKLSSGQGILLYIITEIVANIRLDSLLIFDEPETHLHPNAITQLMNTIYELVNEFQSFCIIATHSPLVIREIPSSSVFILERHSNIPSIRKIGIESFGTNLSILTEEVFENKDVPKQHLKIVQSLIDEGLTYEEIKSRIESDDRSINLALSLFIKSRLKG